MKPVMHILFAGLVMLYPVLVYFGLQHLNVRVLSLFLLSLAMVRFAFLQRKAGKSSGNGILMLAVSVVVAVAALVTNQSVYFLYYPVVMNLAMLGMFAVSLIHPPSIIERLARLQEPDLPPEGVAYTRKVTAVWCVFFVVNGAVAFYTARFCDLDVWTLYNGLIAYIAMGALFAGEFAFRYLVVRR